MDFMNNRRTDLTAYLLLAVLIIFLHYPVINNYWLFDDLQVLKQAVDYHPWEYFFSPQAWQELSVAHVTPLVTLSFDADFTLFGFKPEFFYIHHLLALWLLSVLLYTVLRLWLPRSFAFLGCLLFLVSAPAQFSAEFLCLRHYIEGSILGLLSVYLFTLSLRKKDFRLAALSAALYFLAMTAKEIFVPLIFVILLLPEEKGFLRFKHAACHFLAALIYTVWRWYMLGRVIGGYQSELVNKNLYAELHRIAVVNTYESIRMLTGISSISSFAHLMLLSLTVALLATSFFICLKKRRLSEVAFFGVVLVSVYVPISPSFIFFSADTFESYRFLFLFSLVYSSLVTAMAYQLSFPDKKLNILTKSVHMILVITISIVLISSYKWIMAQREMIVKPLAAEGRFLMYGDPKNLMEKTSILPMSTYYEMMDHFPRLFKKEQIPAVVYDVFFEVGENPASDREDRHVYRYSSKKGMVEITEDYMARRKAFFSRFRTQPFEVRFVLKDGKFNYVLGPYDNGRYFLLAGYRPGIYNTFRNSLPRSLQGGAFLGKVRWYIRFGWESPEGYLILSPELHIDFSKDWDIYWKQ